MSRFVNGLGFCWGCFLVAIAPHCTALAGWKSATKGGMRHGEMQLAQRNLQDQKRERQGVQALSAQAPLVALY